MLPREDSTRAVALRWRARVAGTQNRIDLTVSRDDDDDDDDEHAKESYPNGLQQQCRPRLRQSCRWLSHIPYRLEWTLLLCATITLYAATVAAPPSWWMALTATLQLLILCAVPWQHRFLRRCSASVQHHHQWLQRQVHQLWQENHVWTRRLEQFDTDLERVRELQGQLAHLTVGSNDDDGDNDHSLFDSDGVVDDDGSNTTTSRRRLERLMEITKQFQSVQVQIEQCLRQQVQQEILLAAAKQSGGDDSNGNNNGGLLTGVALERLIVRLQAMPGVVLYESALRDACVPTSSTATKDQTSRLGLLPLLLQHAQHDGGPSPRGSPRVLFSWDPLQLVRNQHGSRIHPTNK